MCQWIRLTMECLSSLSKCSSSRAKPSNSGWNVNRLAGRGASGSSSQRSLAEPVYWCCIVNRLATLTNVVSCHIHWKLCRAPGWCRLGPWSLKSFFRHTDQCPLPRCVVPHSLEVMSCPTADAGLAVGVWNPFFATLTNVSYLVVSCHIHWKLCRAPGCCRLGPCSVKSACSWCLARSDRGHPVV